MRKIKFEVELLVPLLDNEKSAEYYQNMITDGVYNNHAKFDSRTMHFEIRTVSDKGII